MSEDPRPARYRLTIADEGDPAYRRGAGYEVPAGRRLAQLLKDMRRRFGFRVVAIAPDPDRPPMGEGAADER